MEGFAPEQLPLKGHDGQHKSKVTVERMLEPLARLPPRHRGPKAPHAAEWWHAWDPRRKASCFVDPATGEPGPYLRWLCVFRLVCERWTGDESRGVFTGWRSGRAPRPGRLPKERTDVEQALWLALRRVKPAETRAEPPKEWLRGPLYPAQANVWLAATDYCALEEDACIALAAALAEIRAIDGLPPLSMEALIEMPVLEPGEAVNRDAIERFATWLETGTQAAQEDLSRLHCEVMLASQKRSALLRKAKVRLLNTAGDAAASVRPVVNVWSSSNWTGLRAFATTLCLQVKQGDHRTPTSRALRPALVYVPFNRIPSNAENRRPNRQDILDILCSSLGLGHERRRDRTAAGQAQQVEAIQRALTRRRVLLILDGVELASPPFGALLDQLRATDWPHFIRTLIQPHDKELLECGGEYRSRVLVLSNREIAELQAWTAHAAELPGVDSLADAHALLTNSPVMQQRHADLAARCTQLWPSPYARPHARAENRSLVDQYLLNTSTVDALVEDACGMPDEVDLAFACCADASGCTWHTVRPPRPWHQLERDEWRMLVLRAWLHEPAARGRAGRWDTAGATVALQCIALSINGLRLTTLDRALARFAAAMEKVDGEVAASVVQMRAMLSTRHGAAEFSRHYRMLVDLYEDNDLEEVPETLRWFELEASRVTRGSATGDERPLILDLRSEQMREWITAEMLAGSGQQARFRWVQHILADEALTQATAHARRRSLRADDDMFSLRRFLQALFHGLMSLDTASLDPAISRAAGVPPTTTLDGPLPQDDYRRYIFLAEFVYRRSIENAPAWALARGLSREDVRLAALTMLVNPGWARHVLARLHACPEERRSFTEFGAFGAPRAAGFRDAFEFERPHLRGALGVDLGLALLHASLRSGRQIGFAQRAEQVADALARAEGAPARPERWRFGFTKITIDALQATGDPQHLEAVEARCQQQLESLRIHLPWPGFLRLGDRLAELGWDKAAFEQKDLRPMATDLCPSANGQGELHNVSDLLFRLGEILATRADWGDRPLAIEASARLYAHSYAVFWVGDRVRAMAATRDLSEVNWPAVSARAMRYFVRISLKLGKLGAKQAATSEGTERERARSHALAFYAHARGRIDTYSRHFFRLPTERIQGLLLLASAARVRASMARSFSFDPEEASAAHDLLQASFDYLSEARRQIVDHEFNTAVLRRYLLERIKTLNRMGRTDSFDGWARHGLLAQRDMAILKRLSASSLYWTTILQRMEDHAPPDGRGG